MLKKKQRIYPFFCWNKMVCTKKGEYLLRRKRAQKTYSFPYSIVTREKRYPFNVLEASHKGFCWYSLTCFFFLVGSTTRKKKRYLTQKKSYPKNASYPQKRYPFKGSIPSRFWFFLRENLFSRVNQQETIKSCVYKRLR